MELNNIEKLIEKYENAETSLKEEQVLATYFQQHKVPAHLLEYKAMFNYFDESSTERFTKTIPLKTKKPYWKWASVAAAAVLLISVYTFNNDNSLTDAERLEAELAYQETQKAFQLISQNLNKGENIAIAGLQEFDKATSKVFK
ncbi:hypothetical protein UMM65_02160 [Aureibaculum sp. 2210JD6-5]|uniref:hypothetical protein n=1 Tax=Aureibaculum sp. 2210JD6-5 TaxID=3103957 RepID=UPI002AAEFE4A|nr:hypothetical protein [Aureibaculum sp. 2210JD6-5]MDY7394029.1 hypothetical protein [Aureibaculum sp. 2210JD6-5]